MDKLHIFRITIKTIDSNRTKDADSKYPL